MRAPNEYRTTLGMTSVSWDGDAGSVRISCRGCAGNLELGADDVPALISMLEEVACNQGPGSTDRVFMVTAAAEILTDENDVEILSCQNQTRMTIPFDEIKFVAAFLGRALVNPCMIDCSLSPKRLEQFLGTRGPKDSVHATWRTTTRVNPETGAEIGVSFNLCAGGVVRVWLPIELAHHVAGSIQWYIDDHERRKGMNSQSAQRDKPGGHGLI